MGQHSPSVAGDDVGLFLAGRLKPHNPGNPSHKSEIKIVNVGDGAVGKTSLFIRYFNDYFPDEGFMYNIRDNFYETVTKNGVEHKLEGWDTAGQEDYDELRPLSYDGADVFLVCYTVDRRKSFSHVESAWLPEIRQYCPNTPFILVGCRSDLRDTPVRGTPDLEDPVSTGEGRKLAHRLNATNFFECSAKYDRGVGAIFDEIIRIVTVRDRFLSRRERELSPQEALRLYGRVALSLSSEEIDARVLEMEKQNVRERIDAGMGDARRFYEEIGSRLPSDTVRYLLQEFHVVDTHGDVIELDPKQGLVYDDIARRSERVIFQWYGYFREQKHAAREVFQLFYCFRCDGHFRRGKTAFDPLPVRFRWISAVYPGHGEPSNEIFFHDEDDDGDLLKVKEFRYFHQSYGPGTLFGKFVEGGKGDATEKASVIGYSSADCFHQGFVENMSKSCPNLQELTLYRLKEDPESSRRAQVMSFEFPMLTTLRLHGRLLVSLFEMRGYPLLQRIEILSKRSSLRGRFLPRDRLTLAQWNELATSCPSLTDIHLCGLDLTKSASLFAPYISTHTSLREFCIVDCEFNMGLLRDFVFPDETNLRLFCVVLRECEENIDDAFVQTVRGFGERKGDFEYWMRTKDDATEVIHMAQPRKKEILEVERILNSE